MNNTELKYIGILRYNEYPFTYIYDKGDSVFFKDWVDVEDDKDVFLEFETNLSLFFSLLKSEILFNSFYKQVNAYYKNGSFYEYNNLDEKYFPHGEVYFEINDCPDFIKILDFFENKLSESDFKYSEELLFSYLQFLIKFNRHKLVPELCSKLILFSKYEELQKNILKISLNLCT